MNKYNYSRTIIFLLLITLIACGKDNEIQMAKEYPGVDVELWGYFEKFEREAADRGINIDLVASGITGVVEKIHTFGTVGLCNHRLDQPNHVIIDTDFWASASDNSKEMIIFHELGHCYLERGHNDNKNRDGTCASIMRSGRGGCIDFYTKANKGEYLDELYNGKEAN